MVNQRLFRFIIVVAPCPAFAHLTATFFTFFKDATARSGMEYVGMIRVCIGTAVFTLQLQAAPVSQGN